VSDKREYLTIRRRPMQKSDDWQVWAGRRILKRGFKHQLSAQGWAALKGYGCFIPSADHPNEGRCYRVVREVRL
jgi:hypothetical protein